MSIIDISQSQEIFSVSRLNREARFLLENHFMSVWIEGEISNFTVPQSGHWYFSLKDDKAQVRCAMFKPHHRKLSGIPKDGTHVVVRARVSLYEGRGDFQLLVEHLEEAGLGKLQREFEALKKRLTEAGLFDAAHKKALPAFPKCIGVVTSKTGAAIRDILHILKKRCASVPVIIYPTLVQGEMAADGIIRAIELANGRQECDALILARGGGSIEDLWSFNDEHVAYAIFKSRIPIVTGVGHEIDFTIADFVADVRAPTPSAAAVLLAPDGEMLMASLSRFKQNYLHWMKQLFLRIQQNIDWANKELAHQHPHYKLIQQKERLEQQTAMLIGLQWKALHEKQALFNTLQATFKSLTPSHAFREMQQILSFKKQQLFTSMMGMLQQHEQALMTFLAKIETLSPASTLRRGFSIATKNDNTLIHSATDVTLGEKIHVQLMNGRLGCIIQSFEK